MLNILTRLLGSANDRLVKSYDKTVSIINDLEPKYHAMSDDELRAQTNVLRERLKAGEKEKNILPDAFALVREAAIRTVGMRHFNVQLIGGMVLNDGHKYMEVHDHKWLQWCLDNSFKGGKQDIQSFYVIKKEDEHMGFVMTKERFRVETQGMKNVKIGSIVEWGHRTG